MDLDLSEGREPTGVDAPDFLAESDDGVQGSRVADGIVGTGAPEERGEASEGASICGSGDDGLDERLFGPPGVPEVHSDVGELEKQGGPLLGVTLDFGE